MFRRLDLFKKTMEPCTVKVSDRYHAGILLARKLQEYQNVKAIVAGISRGGVIVAEAVASSLKLPLEIVPCRKIAHPVEQYKMIGTVGLDNVVIRCDTHDIPQDYISHQVAMLQNDLLDEMEFYGEKWNLVSIENRVIILVDDIMRTGDTMKACITSIADRSPAAIIVAVPFVSAESVLLIEELCHDVVYIRMESEIFSSSDFFETFPGIRKEEIKQLLEKAKKCKLGVS